MCESHDRETYLAVSIYIAGLSKARQDIIFPEKCKEKDTFSK